MRGRDFVDRFFCAFDHLQVPRLGGVSHGRLGSGPGSTRWPIHADHGAGECFMKCAKGAKLVSRHALVFSERMRGRPVFCVESATVHMQSPTAAFPLLCPAASDGMRSERQSTHTHTHTV